MAAPVLIRGGRTLYLVSEGARILERIQLSQAPEGYTQGWATPERFSPPPAVRSALSRFPGTLLGEPILADALGASGLSLPDAPLPRIRSAREAIAWPPIPEERATFLSAGRAALQTALASPEQTLIALAREEERVARAGRREVEAAAHLIAGGTGELAQYLEEQAVWSAVAQRHHRALVERLRRVARSVVPNLSEIVGDLVAARLVAAAGGVRSLARMSSSRLQLLGSRRRAGPERSGPRFGILFGAVHPDGLPPDRQGAYARSLGALAVIAVRADAYTQNDISAALCRRRDRRLAALRGGRS